MGSRCRRGRDDEYGWTLEDAPEWAFSQGIPAPSHPSPQRIEADLLNTPLAGSATWKDVRRWLSEVGPREIVADAALRPLLLAFKREPNESWYSVLVYLFWTHLVQAAKRLHRLEKDPAALYSQTCWAFLRALHRLDLGRRPEGLGKKLLNDVQHDLRQFYAREQRRKHRRRAVVDVLEMNAPENERGVVLGGEEDAAFLEKEFQHDRAWALARLKCLVRSGRLPRTDFLILIGCHLYGRTIEEMALRQGLSYQAAKQRRLRAADFLKVFAPELSPDLPDTPLRYMRRAPRREKSHDGEL